MPRSRLWYCLALFIVSLAACEDRVVPTEVAGVARAEKASAPLFQEREFEGEEILRDLAASEPSIGGLFINRDGRLTVLVTDQRRNDAAARVTRQLAAIGRIRGLPKPFDGVVVVEPTRYSLRELATWRRMMTEEVRSFGAVWMDLNERANRIDVGVRASDVLRANHQLAAELEGLGIPSDVVRFYEAGDFRLATGTARSAWNSSPNLNSHADTLVGGLGIGWQGPTAAGLCSIAFIADQSIGGRALITASHCSPTIWGLDTSNSYAQPWAGIPIGTEVVDPSPGTCPLLWPCSDYRFSDAALGSISGRAARTGYLARPAYRSFRSGGTTTLNPWGAYLTVYSTTGDIIQGGTIDHLGSTTGWLYGNVEATCVTRFDEGRGYRCSYVTNIGIEGGDSGGSVFYYDGHGGVTAAGVIFASGGWPWASNGSWFSKWTHVASELAPSPAWLNIVANDIPVVPSATIIGPDEVQPSQSCYWYVSANSQWTSATWYVNGQPMGTGPDFYYTASSSFTLSVQLTGAIGFGTSKHVEVSSSSAACYAQ